MNVPTLTYTAQFPSHLRPTQTGQCSLAPSSLIEFVRSSASASRCSGCRQERCQAGRQAPSRGDKSGISVQKMATRGQSRTACPCLRITHLYAATSPMSTEATFFAMVNSLCCQLLAAQLDPSHADRRAGSRCTRPRTVRHQRTSAPNVRICTRSGRESILGWVDQAVRVR